MQSQERLNDLQRLGELAPLDVYKLALTTAGKSPQKVSEAMGWDTGQTNRIFSPEKYWPSYPQLPKLCHILGNTILIDWLMIRAMRYGLDETHQDVDCKNLALRVADLFGEVGDVGRSAQAALEDGKLEPKELRAIIRELTDVGDKTFGLIADLRVLERDIVQRAKDGAK